MKANLHHSYTKHLYLLVFLIQIITPSLFSQTYVRRNVVVIQQLSYSQTRVTDPFSSYTIPLGGPYKIIITATGARGGTSSHARNGSTDISRGGRGAVVRSSFNLASGTVLQAYAGSNGEDWATTIQTDDNAAPNDKYSTGGGGASGVQWVGVGPLLIAGGGGGTISGVRNDAQGGDATEFAAANADPIGGGSHSQNTGGGGGGLNSNGGNAGNGTSYGGGSFVHGGHGGYSAASPGTVQGVRGGSGFAGGGSGSKEGDLVIFTPGLPGQFQILGGGGGGGGYVGGNAGNLQFRSQGGYSFVSTLGYEIPAIELSHYSSEGGRVEIAIFARYSDFGTIIPSGIPDDLVFEFNQLEALYRATNGVNWTNKTNWLTGGDMSQWAGVTLTPDGKSILKIELPGNNLTGGNIPDLNLAQLTTLNLSGNSITGAIPNFNYLPQLQRLLLFYNQFSGSVPNFINSTGLQELNLVGNQLTGSVPIFPDYNWLSIDLGLNQLTGTLPALNLELLQFFSVHGNQLSGVIPNLYLPSIQTIHLSNNNFSGNLPNINNVSGSFAPNNVYIQNNRFNFGNILGKLLIQGTRTVVYAPQQKIAITNTNGVLEVNTGIPNGDNSQDYYWYKDNGATPVAVTKVNWYRPTATGVYRVEVKHNTLTNHNSVGKTLILVSNDITVSSLVKSNAGRIFPADLPPCLVDDFNELEKIYDTTAGANWTNKTNWFTNGNISTWYGVMAMSADGCDVTSINLERNNLTGTIPNFSFPSLVFLSLSTNNLTGTIPNLNLPALQIVGFDNNQLTGQIPTFNAPNLSYLAMNNNQLSGNVPNFTNLTTILIQNNRFIFSDFVGKAWLNAGTVNYNPQAKIPTTFASCQVNVNTGVVDNTQTFVWFKNGVEVSRNSNGVSAYTITGIGTYKCLAYHFVLTNSTQTGRNLVLESEDYIVSELTPSASIVANNTFIAQGDGVTFTATPTNAGASPRYDWYVNNALRQSNTNPTYTANGFNALNNGDVIYCKIWADNTCYNASFGVNSNSITMRVCSYGSPRVYVKPVATGTGNGDSWANATDNLNGALNNPCQIQEIWVAAGTYKPDRDATGNTLPTDPRTKTFYFSYDKKLYGSFAGTETDLSQRTPSVIAANPTILSGDFSNNDSYTGSGSSLNATNIDENAYHVVSVYDAFRLTVLDGFTIKGGNANVVGTFLGVSNNDCGGGLYSISSSSSFKLANCNFVHNSASFGGAIFSYQSGNTGINLIFDRNFGSVHGGAICNRQSFQSIAGAVFSGNRSQNVGGAIYSYTSGSYEIVNATFNNNYSTQGVIFNDNTTTTGKSLVFWGNSGTNADFIGASGGITITQSVVEGGYTGTGNVSTNPNFKTQSDPDGADNLWRTADDGLQLGCQSPAFNTGSDVSNYGLFVDILGNARSLLGVTDRGAYESSNFLSITVSLTETAGCGNVIITAVPTPNFGTETYSWNVGSMPTAQSNIFTSNGAFVRVTVTNSTGCSNVGSIDNITRVMPKPTRIYVNAANASANIKNGSSWATAFDNLQSALTTCKAEGAEIWVANGIYKPSVDVAGNATPTNNRTKTFNITGNVSIYGGFVGTETALSQRPTPSVSPSILSGDFNGDDVVSGNGSGLVFNNNGENAYHVVTANYLTQTVRLDGFTISGGNANLIETYYNYGGGVINVDGGANFTLANCILTKNTAVLGGGMANVGNASGQIVNCVFEKNYASLHGAGVVNFSGCSPTFSNCVFSGNWAQVVGGAMYNLLNANAVLRNCTIVGNAANDTNGGAIYNDGSNPTITNTVIWANVPANPFGSFNGGTPMVTYSTVQGGISGTGNGSADPNFTNIADPDGTDNIWRTNDDGLRLACGSGAFNTGTTTSLTTDILGASRNQQGGIDQGAYENSSNVTKPTVTIISVDNCGSITLTANVTPAQAGTTYAWSGGSTPSVSSNTFTTLGTYSVSVTVNFTNGCSTIQTTNITVSTGATRLYVNAGNTNPMQDGSSWEKAFNSLQSAISACRAANAEIWVAKGTYKPVYNTLFGTITPNNWNNTFLVPSGVQIYGSFAGTETNLSERTPLVIAANPTYLSGDFSDNDLWSGASGTLTVNDYSISDNTNHVVTFLNPTQPTRLDGFIIKGGQAALNDTYYGVASGHRMGGGAFVIGGTANVTLENCHFLLNTANGNGAALAIHGGSVAVKNSTFDRNRAKIHGAAIYTGNGGNVTVSNSIFWGNRALSVGAVLYNLGSSQASFTHCTAANNAATAGGGSIYNDGSNTTLTNSIIWQTESSTDQFGSFNGGIASPTYCVIENYSGGTNNYNTSPNFLNINSPMGADNQWFTSDDGLNLTCGSSAFNTGNNAQSVATDVKGTSRPQFERVDIGAYESINFINANVTITETAICNSTTLTAMPLVALPSGSTYTWTGGTASAINSKSFTEDGTYSVTVTLPNSCTSIASTTIILKRNVVPSVSIVANPSSLISAGANVTFTATPTNGGTTPQYQWYVNNNPVGTNSPTFSNSIWAAGDEVKCVLTANNECQTTPNANSNLIKMVVCQAGNRLYVKPTASGTGDGSSWANAMGNLHQAINNACGITEIWVAGGTYKPVFDENGVAKTDNTRVFVVPNGIQLYGGFVGTETTLSQRTPSVLAANSTILSGDFNSDDVVTGTGSTLALTNYAENATHIVGFNAPSVATRLDGFTVMGGSGGAIGAPIFGVTKGEYGGGIFVKDGGSNLTIANCIITKNGGYFAGGMYCQNAMPKVIQCVFEKNTVIYHGAGMGNFEGSMPDVQNCIFVGNGAGFVGGGIVNFGGSNMSLINSTISSNSAQVGGGVYNDNSNITMLNSIIWNNVSDGLHNVQSTPTVTYSILQESHSGTGNITTNPFFKEIADPDGVDNIWRTADDGLQLLCKSPAYNAGSATGAPSVDLLNVSRPQHGGIDIGAYEGTMNFTLINRIYVNAANTNPVKDGLTWATAYSELQDAFEGCIADNGEIWVAKGTYKPSKNEYGVRTNDNTRVFVFQNGIKLYGGFAGTEVNLSERTPSLIRANPTILSGDFNNNDVVTGTGSTLSFINYGENAYHIVAFNTPTAATRLDGCTISGGSGGGGNIFNKNLGVLGGGLWILDASTHVTIANCIITKNGAYIAGGIFNQNSSPTITYCVFDRNSASVEHGGGLGNFGASQPIVTNCIFSGNYARIVGGGLCNFAGSTMTLNNSTISGNYAQAGGGIYNDNSNATVFNSIIWNNTTDGLHNIASTPSVTYSILQAAYTGNGNSTNDPKFISVANPIGTDGLWGTADDGLRLSCNSPARDAGDITGAPTTDYTTLGIFNTLKDMGAYESQNNDGCPIYVGSATCGSATINDVKGNKLYNFFINNLLIATLNPNGQDLGNVTVEIGDPTGATTDGVTKYIGRHFNITSTKTPTQNYTLCLYYKDSEVTEFSTAAGQVGNYTLSQLFINWKSGGTGCNWTSYSSTSSGSITNNTIVNRDYGVGLDGFYLQFNLNHFTMFGATASGTALPVTLIDFQGKTIDKSKNVLTWHTGIEINNKGFHIRRSGDGKNFETIGFVPASATKSYQFTDDIPLSISYYQLRQEDFDGKTELSKIISLYLDKNVKNAIYPNPVTDYITIEQGENEPITATFINALGQIVLTKTLTATVSNFDISDLPSGMYKVVLRKKNSVLHHVLIVKL